jgi:hypothetical protein
MIFDAFGMWELTRVRVIPSSVIPFAWTRYQKQGAMFGYLYMCRQITAQSFQFIGKTSVIYLLDQF